MRFALGLDCVQPTPSRRSDDPELWKSPVAANHAKGCYDSLEMSPGDWNVVVLGAWNRAILTPAWIARVVFGLSPDSPLEVMIPLDVMAPFQVRHGGLIVTPAFGQLIVQIEEPSAASLASALEAMKRAILDLPRTPLRACGVNIRYTSPEPDGTLVERTRCQTDSILAEAGHNIRVRRRGETMTYRAGSLHFIADIPTTGPTVLTFNFDRQCATHQDALDWLNQSAEEYVEQAAKVLALVAE